MSIPFTQYKLPHGRRVPVSIDMPKEIESIANAFIEKGGWFDVEIIGDSQVSLTARFIVDGEPQDIACEISENGPPIILAVEHLVRNASAIACVIDDDGSEP